MAATSAGPARAADASRDIHVNSSGDITDTNHLTGWLVHPPGSLTAAVYLSIAVIWLSFAGHQMLSRRRASGEHGQQLYDIDKIISRTLAYGIATGLLVGLYAGLVLLVSRAEVLRLHTPVAVAVSTLAAEALFSPLRRRVQRAVDRLFNRARYDAGQMVMAFAARLKDTVDLHSVHSDLADVATKALEPAHLSVWEAERR